jgi:hypothetical protein
LEQILNLFAHKFEPVGANYTFWSKSRALFAHKFEHLGATRQIGSKPYILEQIERFLPTNLSHLELHKKIWRKPNILVQILKKI